MNLNARTVPFLVGFIAFIAIRGRFAGRTRASVKTVRRVDGTEKILLSLVGVTALLLPILFLFTPWLKFAGLSASRRFGAARPDGRGVVSSIARTPTWD
jgi:hypothetical protein